MFPATGTRSSFLLVHVMDDKAAFKVIALAALVALSIWGVVAYVAFHFIVKLW